MAMLEFDIVDEPVACSMNGCDDDSAVYITCGAIDLWKTPFCSVCAPLKFAQWMVEIHGGSPSCPAFVRAFTDYMESGSLDSSTLIVVQYGLISRTPRRAADGRRTERRTS